MKVAKIEGDSVNPTLGFPNVNILCNQGSVIKTRTVTLVPYGELIYRSYSNFIHVFPLMFFLWFSILHSVAFSCHVMMKVLTQPS